MDGGDISILGGIMAITTILARVIDKLIDRRRVEPQQPYFTNGLKAAIQQLLEITKEGVSLQRATLEELKDHRRDDQRLVDQLASIREKLHG